MNEPRRIAYTIELTRDEYRSACVMSDRGYLGEITIHATAIEPSNDDDDQTTVYRLLFTEADAWRVQETIDADPVAVWSLTTPSTSLGAKFQRFTEAIV